MQSYNPSLPLISIHVPKTGGTSVRACLQAWFGPDRLFLHYPDEAAAGAPVRYVLGPRSCVHGHFNKHRGFGVRQFYPDASQWIVFLRDPFEQHISLFFYLRKYEGRYFFAGRPVPMSAWDRFDGFLDYLADNRDVLQTSPANTFLAHLPLDTREHDADALFDRFIHVGTTAELGRSLRLLATKLGVSPQPIPYLNVSPRDLPTSESSRRRHELLFPIEHDLYGRAAERHRRELAASD